MREYITSKASTGGAVEEVIPDWVYPEEWVDISNPLDNTINLCTTDAGQATVAYTVSTVGNVSYSVNWGDGITTVHNSNSLCQHTYVYGSGKDSGKGFYTYKVVISSTNTITRFLCSRHNLIAGERTGNTLAANLGTRGLLSMYNMFSGYGVVSVVFNEAPNTVTSLEGAFSGCGLLEIVKLPSSMPNLTTLNSCFSGCAVLRKINLPTTLNSITTMRQMCISCYTLLEITLPTEIAIITDLYKSFENCFSLGSVKLPSSLNTLTTMADCFKACYSLRSAEMPTSMNSLTTLAGAFTNNYSLKSITLPESLPVLTTMATMCTGCTVMNTITIPSVLPNVTNINSAFTGTYTLNKIAFPVTMNNLLDASYLFSNSGVREIQLPTQMNAVTNLSNTFAGCYNLTEIVLPNSLPNVTNTSNLFHACRNLKSISLPASLNSVTNADYMFSTLTALKSVNVPSMPNIRSMKYMFINSCILASISNIDTLGSQTLTVDATGAFAQAESLTELIIGALLTKIGAQGGGSSSYVNKLTSLRLTNPNSTFTGSSPQVDVNWTLMGAAALNTLFGDIPTLTGKAINITGCTGAATCDRSIATAKDGQ